MAIVCLTLQMHQCEAECSTIFPSGSLKARRQVTRGEDIGKDDGVIGRPNSYLVQKPW